MNNTSHNAVQRNTKNNVLLVVLMFLTFVVMLGYLGLLALLASCGADSETANEIGRTLQFGLYH